MLRELVAISPHLFKEFLMLFRSMCVFALGFAFLSMLSEPAFSQTKARPKDGVRSTEGTVQGGHQISVKTATIAGGKKVFATRVVVVPPVQQQIWVLGIYGEATQDGFFLDGVVQNGPASRLRGTDSRGRPFTTSLERDDAIVAIDGVVITSLDDYVYAINNANWRNADIEIVDSRTGQTMHLFATLARRR
jgi:hypothetical protein